MQHIDRAALELAEIELLYARAEIAQSGNDSAIARHVRAAITILRQMRDSSDEGEALEVLMAELLPGAAPRNLVGVDACLVAI